MRRNFLFFTGINLLILAACASTAGSPPTSTPAALAGTSVPTDTIVVITETPVPTDTVIPVTATPVPGATPLHPPNSLLAADKLSFSTLQNPVLLSLPGMDQVTVGSARYAEALNIDIYYPPDFDFTVPKPAVIFVFGISDAASMQQVGSAFKDMGQYVSWGQLVAASGLIAVTYETGQSPIGAINDVIAYLAFNGPWLGINTDRLCLWSGSSHSVAALRVLTDTTREYRDSLACGVIYYGSTALTSPLRDDIPLFVVEAGQDDPEENLRMEDFVSQAQLAGVQVEFVKYDDGVHGFETIQDTDETHDIVRRTLEFLKTHLLPP